MDNNRDVSFVRIFALFLCGFVLYLAWVPPFASLQHANGRVSSTGFNGVRFSANFMLDNGQTLHCSAKGWWMFGSQICPSITLKPAFDTQEIVTFHYSGQKVWGAETQDKRMLINYASIRNSRWGVMILSTIIFLGMFFFAPRLISSNSTGD